MNLFGQLSVNLKDLGATFDQGGKVYGSYCGIAGQHPPSRVEIEKMISTKDLAGISDWLQSPNKVIQTYAAEAVIRLSETETFSDEDLALVDQYRKSTDLISTCTGCMYEKLSMKEALKNVESDMKRERHYMNKER